jgi:hypothetical protein
MGVHQQLWSRNELLSQGLLQPGAPGTVQDEGKLEIAVLFTSAKATLAAIETAAALMKGLEGRLSLIGAQTVPYPLPLDKPPVSLAFNTKRLLEVAANSRLDIDISVQVCVCRCRSAMLLTLLRPGSMLVIGGRKTWWPTWERKLAKELRRDGLDVVLLEVGSETG